MKYYLPFLVIIIFLINSCSDGDIVSPAMKGDRINSSFASVIVDDQVKTKELNLVQVIGSDVDEEGYAEEWTFIYCTVSPADSCYYYLISSESVELDVIEERIIGLSVIDNSLDDLLNSNEALAVAQKNGGEEFLKNYPGSKINVSLIKAGVPDSTPTWRINYSYGTDLDMPVFAVDAITGELK